MQGLIPDRGNDKEIFTRRTLWVSMFHWFIFKDDALNRRKSIGSTIGLTQGACILSSKGTSSSQIKVAALHVFTMSLFQKSRASKFFSQFLLETVFTRNQLNKREILSFTLNTYRHTSFIRNSNLSSFQMPSVWATPAIYTVQYFYAVTQKGN